MEVKLVLVLCVALIFATTAHKVTGEEEEPQLLTNSNLTHTTSTNVTFDGDSKNMTLPLGDGSEINKEAEEDPAASASIANESSSARKKKKEGEECGDPSNMCIDELHQFIACLRVPGNDAPHLSLLIQNKANSDLLLTIKAPTFVGFDKSNLRLPQNHDTKVKVSINNNKGGSNDTSIILSSTNGGLCTLDFKDFAVGSDRTIPVSRPSFLNISSRTLIVILMISFLVTSLVIIPVIIHLYRNKSQEKSKYQRLDMELPVSNNALLSELEQETGWNNNWGDDWDDGDDEEQPVLPLTPSVSSKGLAPRRLSKEGWKD